MHRCLKLPRWYTYLRAGVFTFSHFRLFFFFCNPIGILKQFWISVHTESILYIGTYLCYVFEQNPNTILIEKNCEKMFSANNENVDKFFHFINFAAHHKICIVYSVHYTIIRYIVRLYMYVNCKIGFYVVFGLIILWNTQWCGVVVIYPSAQKIVCEMYENWFCTILIEVLSWWSCLCVM